MTLLGRGAEAAAPSRADALRLDHADPLAEYRSAFAATERDGDGGRIYLDGNSLGRQPLAAVAAVERRLAEWREDLVSGWHRWIDLPRTVGDLLATGVLGARSAEVLVADSTTVNLYKLAGAALAARPGVVVTDRGNFPTDRYVLEGLAAAHRVPLRLIDDDAVLGPTADAVAAACTSGDVRLVCLSHVAYRSGALADLAAITRVAHTAGALVLWDLSHSAGVLPIDLEAHGVDLAVGCTYKYLNGGPGAPAFLYVRSDLQERLRSPIQGWFGQHDQFRMERDYEPEPGIGRWATGTPGILGLAAVEAGVTLAAAVGPVAMARKAARLTELVVTLHDAWLEPLGFTLGTPRAPGRRGAHVSVRHPDAWQICRALIDAADVVPDFRDPDSIRLGVPPLTTRFVDVWDALDRLRGLVAAGGHRLVDARRGRVT